MQDGESQAETLTAAPASDPVFSASPTVSWLGFGVLVVVFLVVFIFLIRSRLQSAPRGSSKPAPSDFFQPAGEGAEIAFDDAPAVRVSAAGRKAHQGHLSETVEDRRRDEPLRAAPDARAAPATADRRSSPFAGLFAKKKQEEEAARAAPLEDVEVEVIPAEPSGIHPLAADRRRRIKAFEDDDAGPREEERRIEAERAAQEEEARRLEAERRAAEREAEFEHRKRMAALRNAETAQDMRGEIDALRRDLVLEFDERFSALSRKLESAAPRREEQRGAPSDASLHASLLGDMDERLAMLSEHMEQRLARAGGQEALRAFADHRDAVESALYDLEGRVGALSGLQSELAALKDDVRRLMHGRAPAPSAPLTQLADVVKDALPPQAYELRAQLGNGRIADCVIRLPGPIGAIAVDAGFPAEAFHALFEARPGADDEFRRALLRHIVDVSERLVAPQGRDASALLFVPSESFFAELQARFADLVQESQRARVHIVSPTTLMATLHTLSALLGAERNGRNGKQLGEIQSAISAIDARLRALEAPAAPQAVDTPSEGNAAEAPAAAADAPQAKDKEPPSGAVLRYENPVRPFPLR